MTKREAVAALFRAHPGVWIDAHELLRVGGFAAWRTRVSDARQDLSGVIENQVLRYPGYTVTRYRYLPDRLPLEAA